MTTEGSDLLEQIKFRIGLDAYHIYPDSRHAIPDAVLWGFASACLLEFAKTFVDFKGLGEGLRKKADALLVSWFGKKDFPEMVSTIDHSELANKIISLLPAEFEDSLLMAATVDLAAALERLGVKPVAAQRHAAAIAQKIATAREASSQ